MMRYVGVGVLVIAGLLLVPAATSAQAIGGTVTDATGSVLPGVTVEARSPVLIEQVRSAVTDGAGKYQIIELRPGAYRLTFTLAGFSTVVREGSSSRPGSRRPSIRNCGSAQSPKRSRLPVRRPWWTSRT